MVTHDKPPRNTTASDKLNGIVANNKTKNAVTTTVLPSSSSPDTKGQQHQKTTTQERSPILQWKQSIQQVVLWTVLLSIAVGIVIGYIVFVGMYYSKCNKHISSAIETNVASCIKHLEADDDEVLYNKKKLQQAMNENTELQSKHKYLLDLHEETVARLSILKKEYNNHKHGLENQIIDLQKVIEQTKKESDELKQMKESIKRRSLAEIEATCSYRSKNPYTCYVEFTVTGGDVFVITFTPEIIRDMPHTIVTFLQMIQLGLYHNTNIVIGTNYNNNNNSATIISNDVLIGGNSKTRNAWTERYMELGYTVPYPTFFEEVSTRARCTQYSLGLRNERGPEFIIVLDDSNNNNEDLQYSCPGRILPKDTNSVQTIQKIQSALSSNDEITITNAELTTSTDIQEKTQRRKTNGLSDEL